MVAKWRIGYFAIDFTFAYLAAIKQFSEAWKQPRFKFGIAEDGN